jgi:hypothetical protein
MVIFPSAGKTMGKTKQSCSAAVRSGDRYIYIYLTGFPNPGFYAHGFKCTFNVIICERKEKESREWTRPLAIIRTKRARLNDYFSSTTDVN